MFVKTPEISQQLILQRQFFEAFKAINRMEKAIDKVKEESTLRIALCDAENDKIAKERRKMIDFYTNGFKHPQHESTEKHPATGTN